MRAPIRIKVVDVSRPARNCHKGACQWRDRDTDNESLTEPCREGGSPSLDIARQLPDKQVGRLAMDGTVLRPSLPSVRGVRQLVALP